MQSSDFDLLQKFATENSDEAFTSLVNRYLNLVYSAALRQVRSQQIAEEIAQSVFLDLSRSAKSFKPDTLLSGWLFQVTRRTAIDFLRKESRRQLREQIAVELAAMNSPEPDWTHIQPMLDEAMETLSTEDRNAVLMRFFEQQSFREVGENFGASENAAQKRVARAVEQLRDFFAKRGVAIGTASFVALLSVNAVKAAPAGLSGTISSALSTAAISHAGVAAKTFIMTTTQKILVATAVVAVVGIGVYEVFQPSETRARTGQLSQQHISVDERLARAERERDDAINRLTAAQKEIARLHDNVSELAKLRNEVARLRESVKAGAAANSNSTNDLTEAALRAWIDRVKTLKQRFETWPKKTPEIALLSEQEWLDQTSMVDSATDAQIRQTMSNLRFKAQTKFSKEVNKAFEEYIKANNGKKPMDAALLTPYLPPPMDSWLEQFEVVKPGSVTVGNKRQEWAMAQKGTFTPTGTPTRDRNVLADPDHDMLFIIYEGGGYGYNP